MGVDTVISTVTGNAQLRLIEAAVATRVRRFAPAEFEGQPGLRSQNDPLDRGRALALAHLQHYRSYIQSTVFVCGILFERFSVNGMRGHHIGAHTGYGNEGDYIVDVRNMNADAAPAYDSVNNPSYLCLTSAYDVGRFVVEALNMTYWPAEMSMCGDRMSVHQLLEVIKTYRGMISAAENIFGLQLILCRPTLQQHPIPEFRKPPVPVDVGANGGRHSEAAAPPNSHCHRRRMLRLRNPCISQ
jgi:hypothetical protein